MVASWMARLGFFPTSYAGTGNQIHVSLVVPLWRTLIQDALVQVISISKTKIVMVKLQVRFDITVRTCQWYSGTTIIKNAHAWGDFRFGLGGLLVTAVTTWHHLLSIRGQRVWARRWWDNPKDGKSLGPVSLGLKFKGPNPKLASWKIC